MDNFTIGGSYDLYGPYREQSDLSSVACSEEDWARDESASDLPGWPNGEMRDINSGYFRPGEVSTGNGNVSQNDTTPETVEMW